MTEIPTVRGPICSAELGVTLMHEHLCFREGEAHYAQPGDYRVILLQRAVDVGTNTLVDMTPYPDVERIMEVGTRVPDGRPRDGGGGKRTGLGRRAVLRVLLLGGMLAAWAMEAGTAQPDAEAGNLLRNPHFAFGDGFPDWWRPDGRAEGTTAWLGREGEPDAYCVFLHKRRADWAGLTSAAFSPAEHEVLTVGAWVRTNRRAGEPDRLFVRFFDGGGAFLTQFGPALPTAAAAWTLVTGEVAVPAGAARADVSLQIRSTGAKAWIADPVLLPGAHGEQLRGQLAPPPEGGYVPVTEGQGRPTDSDGDFIPDVLEEFLGTDPRSHDPTSRSTRRKTVSFQTATGYLPENDLRVDIVITATNAEEAIQSWRRKGYEVHTMVGFRAGPEYLEGGYDGEEHWDEVQTTKDGRYLTCGPNSYYMVPTARRRAIFKEYFRLALRRGAQAVCPEEPESFAAGGYSEAFKREFRRAYGRPWQGPTGSVDARWSADSLKAQQQWRLVREIYQESKRLSPKTPRFLLIHSPIHYAHAGIVFPYSDALDSGLVDEVIAQVWTGTARAGCRYAGDLAERTFENAYLEYRSMYDLVRGRGLRLWVLNDPVEDNPDRTMEDYRFNYHRTLAASLLMTDVEHHETMPWPTRIFGRVPAAYATEIGSVVNALSDLQNQEEVEWLQGGSDDIGTFVADTMLLQRGEPWPSTMDSFYGLSLPLVMRGVRLQVPWLERCRERGYLEGLRVLLLSYDMMKPGSPRVNESLARWVRERGVLLLFGGPDAYNELDAWWRREGYEWPQDHLAELLGVSFGERQVVPPAGVAAEFTRLVATDYQGREFENRKVERLDLTPYLSDSDHVLLKFEDTMKEDGWGPLLVQVRVEGQRGGRPFTAEFRPGSPEEKRYLVADAGSQIAGGDRRFADREAYFIYRFDLDKGSRGTVLVEIGNQYAISASTADIGGTRQFEAPSPDFRPEPAVLQLPSDVPLVLHTDAPGAVLACDATGRALITAQPAGEGQVIYCGLPAAYFARRPEGAELVRALTAHAMAQAGGEYREARALVCRRGQYFICRAFDEPVRLSGLFVNVLDPQLPVVREVEVGAGEVGLLYDVRTLCTGGPKLLYSSSYVGLRRETEAETGWFAAGAAGTVGRAVLFGAGREPVDVRAMGALGEAVEVSSDWDGGMLHVSYETQHRGTAFRVRWGAGDPT